MNLEIYQVDAFSDQLFSGNPAAVVPLKEWLSDELMQKIAAENNLAETAFFLKTKYHFELRWFTPLIEVDLCGHATLASAHVLFNHLGYGGNKIEFKTRSGMLSVTNKDKILSLNFPITQFKRIEIPPLIVEGLGLEPKELYFGMDYMAIYNSEEEVKLINPDFRKLAELEGRGVIVTSPGKDVDFVSRFFAPGSGIDEDPVTGSAHTMMAPYWSKILGKKNLSAIQLSPRSGNLNCSILDDRVEISGKAITYLKGTIEI